VIAPGHLARLIQAETIKLFSRSSARFGLVFALLVGLAVPIVRGLIRLLEVKGAQGADVDIGAIDAAYIVYATLWLRNFFLMRIVLIMMGALTFAGEFQSRALREDVLRPVPRWAILFAKWVSLDIWIVATLILTFVVSSVFSIVAWGTVGDWTQTGLGYIATIAADAGFAALVLAMAVILRGVAGTMVGMFLFYVMDMAFGFFLVGLAYLPDVFFKVPEVLRKASEVVQPWLPSSAFGVWQGASPTAPWAWQGFLSLAILTVISLVVAERVFSRIDVP
jgi:ABC-type transport system involved in multi-copper enzyme maturation permease subunit